MLGRAGVWALGRQEEEDGDGRAALPSHCLITFFSSSSSFFSFFALWSSGLHHNDMLPHLALLLQQNESLRLRRKLTTRKLCSVIHGTTVALHDCIKYLSLPGLPVTGNGSVGWIMIRNGRQRARRGRVMR